MVLYMKQPSTHLQTTLSETRKPLGRQRSKATELLSQFHCKRSHKHPKKEIIRCELIRGIKRAIRQLTEGKRPVKGWHGFPTDHSHADLVWKQLSVLVQMHSQALKAIAHTNAGPKTDGKVTRSREGDHSRFNSFNDSFCKWFYTFPAVRSFHRLYIELVFIDLTPESLASKLPFVCCQTPSSHSQTCAEKWKALKNYLMTDMLAELSPKLGLPREFLPKILIDNSKK